MGTIDRQVSTTSPNHNEANFETIIPARIDFLQDPEISVALKGFALVLESVCSKFFLAKDLEKMKGKLKENPSKINTYLKLLRKHGYAKRLYYRCISTKQVAGAVWILTQQKNHFPDDAKINQELAVHGFELMKFSNV
jgi:hypothetical protein